MNKVVLVGNLTKTPELRETTTGKSVCRVDIAINRNYGEGADFFSCTVWGTQAENTAKYLSKGSKVAISGRLHNSTYETEEGEKRTKTEIVVEDIEFLSSKRETEKDEEKPTLEPIEDDDLPF